MDDKNESVAVTSAGGQSSTEKRSAYRQPKLTSFGRVVKMTGSTGGSLVDVMVAGAGSTPMNMGMGAG